MPETAPHELVDIVDENDTILYQAPKNEAHGKGLLHRTVIAELINSRGEWILAEPAPDRQDPGQYGSPAGGHVQAGEFVEDALRREVQEETGLENFDFRFIGKAIFRRQILGRDENHYFILYEIYSDAAPRISNESVGFQTFTTEEIKRTFRMRPETFGGGFHFVAKNFYPELLLP